MKFLNRNVPEVPSDVAAGLLGKHYGVRGSLTELESERDKNFHVKTEDESYLLKVCNADESPEVIDFQIRALQHIERVDPTLPTPRALPTLTGNETAVLHHEDVTYTIRLMSFLEGEIANQPGYDTPEFRHNTGAILARLDRALRSFFHPAANQDHPWNVMQVPRLLDYADKVADQTARAHIVTILERVRDHAIPACRTLRHQIIHQDAHTANLVVDPEDPSSITGIIDFGDLVFAPLVVDLAVAAHLSGRQDGSPESLLDVVLGYDSVTPLEEPEVAVLYDLVLSRLAMSATIAAARVALFPDQDPYESDQERLWKRIAAAVEARDDLRYELRRVLGFGRKSPGLTERRNELLGEHSPHFYDTPLELAAGDGMYLVDPAGKRYLDFYNNVPTVGHNHPQVVNAVSRQMAALNTNTRYLYGSVVEYAEQLTATLGHDLDVCLFVNSGSEANDVASQIVKHHAGHDSLLVIGGSYHGMTEASAAITGEDDSTAPNVAAFGLGQPPDSMPDRLAGFFIDPALTSNGMPRVEDGYLSAVSAQARERGGLVVADEVQSGFGRTGVMWGHEREGIVPDLVTLGKPVGNGFPLGVVVTRREILDRFMAETGLFSTFGGNPVACAAGLAVLDVISRQGLVENSARMGDYLKNQLDTIGHPAVVDVRGTGLLIGLELDLDGDQTRRLIEAMRELGVLVGSAGRRRNVLKLRPPLIARAGHIDQFVQALDQALA